MIVRTIKWLVLLCVLTISSQVNAQASIPDAKEYTIVMVLWRGMTDAERGFKDYLRHELEGYRFQKLFENGCILTVSITRIERHVDGKPLPLAYS